VSEPLHEWACPDCGAVTRARMADRPVLREAELLEALTRAAFSVLSDRKGFDWWWNDIDPEDQREIHEDMNEAFAEALDA
jgi:hypothetical protein